ncbi:MAG: TlpA disulfide reductase family protein [Candidatus Acidiferrales bacterium]
MSRIHAGDAAPDFSLSDAQGKNHSLKDLLKKGPVIAAFFKMSCPTCQFTFPFLQRIHDAYGSTNATLVAISQENAADTAEFCAEYGVKFTALVDGHGYPASNRYGITNVPSIFLISPDGKVKERAVGFARAEIEAMGAEFARANHRPVTPVFRRTEIVPDTKPG